MKTQHIKMYRNSLMRKVFIALNVRMQLRNFMMNTKALAEKEQTIPRSSRQE